MRKILALALLAVLPCSALAAPKAKRAMCQQIFREPRERFELGQRAGLVFDKLNGRRAKFTPTRAQLEAMDAAVDAWVQGVLFAEDPLYAPIAMNRYVASWTGAHHRGKPVIYGFFANQTMIRGEERSVFPRGGDCFFCVWFDPASNTIEKVQVHPDDE
jgi:hypothetical protein